LVLGVGRSEGAENDAGAARQPLGHGFGIGDPGRIGEEKQGRQDDSPRRPWREGRGRPRQGFQLLQAIFPQVASRMSDALASIRSRIAAAETAAGRAPGSVTLVAVSKTQPWDHIAPVLAADQKVFGENRVQEAIERWTPHRDGLELRLIGPLQTNKVRDAVAFFDVIETVDREKLARALADEIARQGKAPRLYVQVNVGEEPQKAGVAPGEADAFIALCRGELGLTIEGLMCIPPADEDPAPHFSLLRAIAKRNGVAKLSMGMSDDFEIAVAQGATSVRVGSAIFGVRSYPQT
jgi:pyridoxal phosphate enzyme (YggS family)